MFEYSYVYAISCDRYHKIGKANDVEARLSNLQIGNPVRCKIAYQRPFNPEVVTDVEKATHRLLAGKRHQGEWFRCTKRQAIEAIEKAARQLMDERARANAIEYIERTMAGPDGETKSALVSLMRRSPKMYAQYLPPHRAIDTGRFESCSKMQW